jgi:hypothetical protein
LSPRPRATFAKRQREQARQEKQRTKAERRLQRKLDIQAGVPPNAEETETAMNEGIEDGKIVAALEATKDLPVSGS